MFSVGVAAMNVISLRACRVLGTKVNPIGMVTGVSHEKLQVYHRWTAWIMCKFAFLCVRGEVGADGFGTDVTSLIHTFPFIVQSIQNGKMVLNWNTTVWYWTGVAALVPQVSVCGDAMGWLAEAESLDMVGLHVLGPNQESLL